MVVKILLSFILYCLCGYSSAMINGTPITKDSEFQKASVRFDNCTATKISDYHFIYNAHCLNHVTWAAFLEKENIWKLYYIDETTASIVQKQVSIKKFFIPDGVHPFNIEFGNSVSEKSDISIVEINELTPEIPVVNLNSNSIDIQLNDVVEFTCFGINELSASESDRSFHNPRHGRQKVIKINNGLIRFEKSDQFPVKLKSGDSGCGVFNEDGNLVAIHANTTVVSRKILFYEKVLHEYEGSVLLAPHFNWIQDVVDGKEGGYVLNSDKKKYVRE